MDDIKQIETYLLGTMPVADALVFRARVLVNPALRQEVRAQKQTYRAIRAWGRRKLKSEIRETERRLLTLPEYEDFRNHITEIFPS